jgi:integrase/recombinase XerD
MQSMYLKVQSETGVIQSPSAENMRQSLKEFGEALRGRPEGLSAYTVRGYLADLKKFAEWFQASKGEELEPGKVTPADVGDYKAHLQTAANFKPATINRRLASLRAYFSWAFEQGLVSQNLARVHNVEEQQTEPRPLDERDYRKLLREAQKHGRARDVAIIQLLRHSGIRLGELCNLTLADVKISPGSGEVTIRSAKQDESRVVPLNRDVRRDLRAYLEEERPEVDDPHLFIGQRRNGLTDAAVQNIVKKHAERAGVKGVSPQVLRHTFARSLLDRGVELPAVQQLMGHKRPESTARYARPGKGDLEAAVARLERKEASTPRKRPARVQETEPGPRKKRKAGRVERREPEWRQW